MRTTAIPVIVDGGFGTIVRPLDAGTGGIAGAMPSGRPVHSIAALVSEHRFDTSSAERAA